jgi:hypothetical protein
MDLKEYVLQFPQINSVDRQRKNHFRKGFVWLGVGLNGLTILAPKKGLFEIPFSATPMNTLRKLF